MNEQAHLYFTEGSSDKEYRAQLEAKDSGFVVNFQYGRRGTTLQSGTKTAQPLDYDKAKKLYIKLIAEKMGKGYTPGEAGTPYTMTDKAAAFTGVVPQLLNSIDECDVPTYLADDRYCMQEKFDGRHLLLRDTPENGIEGINKKGIQAGFPDCLRAEFSLLGQPGCIVDGESIGDTLYVFDLLSVNASSIREKPYSERLRLLAQLLESRTDTPHLVLVKTHYGREAKQARFNEIRKARGEGVVFKLLTAGSTPGKASSLGPQLKFKFTESATCLVAQAHDSKRSVALTLIEEGIHVKVGNVTIPANQAIPAKGDIVEIRYLYAFKRGALFQPVYLGKRDDQDLSACTPAQLKYKPDNYVPDEDDSE